MPDREAIDPRRALVGPHGRSASIIFSRLRTVSNSPAFTSGRERRVPAVALDAPEPCSAASGRYPRIGHEYLNLAVCVCSSPSKTGPFRYYMFGPSPDGPATTASADFCRPIPPSCDAGSTPPNVDGAGRQISQGKSRDLRAIHLSHLRATLRMTSGFEFFALWRGSRRLYALPVRQAGTLPIPSFRSRLAATPLMFS